MDSNYIYFNIDDSSQLFKQQEEIRFLLDLAIKSKNESQANRLTELLAKNVKENSKKYLEETSCANFENDYFELISKRGVTINSTDLGYEDALANKRLERVEKTSNFKLWNGADNKIIPEVFYHGVRKYTPPFIMQGTGKGVDIPFGS